MCLARCAPKACCQNCCSGCLPCFALLCPSMPVQVAGYPELVHIRRISASLRIAWPRSSPQVHP
jgi:hypothetical protein